MFRRHGQKLGFVFLTCDLAVTAAVWFGAYFLRYAAWPAMHGVPHFHVVVDRLPLVLGIAGVAYWFCGLYQIHRLRTVPRELGLVCQASGLLFVLFTTAVFYRRDLYESRLALLVFLALNALSLFAARRAVWQTLQWLRRRGYNDGRAIIVGSGRTGRRVADTIQSNAWTGLRAVGYLDAAEQNSRLRLPRLGSLADLERVVAEHQIDHVFVALPLNRYGELPAVYRALENLLVEVQLVPDVPNLAGMRIRSVEIDAVPFLSLRGNPHYGWRNAVKRGMDLLVGSLALLLLSPLMLFLAAMIKLTSRGPVLYRQPRAGLGERPFDMLKFRSMRIDAEVQSGPVWTRRDDPRCTALGAFMRRWSLDELPQLFNVLAGDMSLVGPRPERSVFVEKFRQEIPNYAQRHQVKAGITGWAQVNGWRGDTSPRRRLECDLYYISNWSLWLDCKILLLTIVRGVRHRNAY